MQKKVWLCLLVLVFSASVASAGYIGDKTILSETLSQGQIAVDLAVEYSSAYQANWPILLPTADANWLSLDAAGLNSVIRTNIPVKLSYGLLDNLTVRLTVPYATVNADAQVSTDASGADLANIALEGLYGIMEESAGAPAISGLLRISLGAGKKMSELAGDEVYVGLRSTDVLLAGIAGKDLGPCQGKMLLGYLYTNPYTENLGSPPDFNVDLPDQVVYSLLLVFPFSRQLEMSGELWGGLSLNKEVWSASGYPDVEYENSLRSAVIFSPGIAFKANDSLTLRGSADLVVSRAPVITAHLPDFFNFTTYNIGGTYTF